MYNICVREKCTGCGLCSNVCTRNAIRMVDKGERGHLVPEINENLCIDCGLCQMKCPVNHELQYLKNKATYAAWQTNVNKREGSSSGGVAAALYEEAIKEGYVIAGVRFTSDLRATFCLTDDENNINAFKGSKYIQADSDMIYRDAAKMIDAGRKVLFIGTPCQCEAMRCAVPPKQIDSLLTVELICHGVPAQRVFSEYLKLIEYRKKRKIDYASFRSNRGVELTLKSRNKTIWKHRIIEDEFLNSFNYGLLFSDACYSCRYACPERCSDLLIGDFWKIGKEIPFDKPKCHVSIVGVFSEKGKSFLNRCSELHLEERTYEEAISGNPNLRQPSRKHLDLDRFWRIYNKDGLKTAYNEIYGNSLKK